MPKGRGFAAHLVKDRRVIGKEIARLLAENRASVIELDAIFNWAKHELTHVDLFLLPIDICSAGG